MDPSAAGVPPEDPPRIAAEREPPRIAAAGQPPRIGQAGGELPPVIPPVIQPAATLPPVLPVPVPDVAPPPASSAAGPPLVPPPISGAPGPAPGPPRAGAGWATVAHLSTLATFVPCNPFGQLLGMVAPLLVWQLGGARDAELEQHAKRAFDFQLTVFLARWALLLTCCCLSCLAWPVFFAWNIALTIWMAVEAANGRCARYPLSLRVLARAGASG
jgi:uncharacterized Tic20 family protein